MNLPLSEIMRLAKKLLRQRKNYIFTTTANAITTTTTTLDEDSEESEVDDIYTVYRENNDRTGSRMVKTLV